MLKNVLPLLGECETAWLRERLRPVQSALRQRGHHEQAADVPVLVRRDEGYAWIPTRVMIRPGMDAPWITGQEFGPTGPRQYLVPGQSVLLANPFRSQAPALIVRVLPALAPAGAATEPINSVAVKADGSAAIDDYRTGTIVAGEARATTSVPARSNGSLWPDTPRTLASGTSRFHATASQITLTADNPTGNEIWQEDDLPSWNCTVALRGRRGLALDVVGDGSGAVLVCQLTGRGVRDYVVKLDFIGPRTIVIPNGEASWATACWGWRFEAKHFDYEAALTKVSLGFGWLPARRSAQATVVRLELLENLPSAWHDPVIRLGQGVLRVQGAVAAHEYLTFSADEGVRVLDRNWNFQRTLPFKAERWQVGPGPVELRIAADGGSAPWLEVQALTQGEPFPIGAGDKTRQRT